MYRGDSQRSGQSQASKVSPLQATAVATVTAGYVTGITVTSGGSGYTSEPAVMISGGGGSGAAAKAILNGDHVASVIVLNAGGGYDSGVPVVTIEPPSEVWGLGVRLVPEITVYGPPGGVGRVEWSPSLSPVAVWTPLTNVVIGIGGVTVVDLAAAASQRFYRVANPGATDAPAGMALIPAGAFQMGDTFDDRHEISGPELPVHTVFVSAFYMDKYEVTKALWDEVMSWSGGNGYRFGNSGSGKSANHPAQTMSWYDAVKWCNARSQKEGRVPAYYIDEALTQVYMTGDRTPYVKWNAGYRLPTEAEWEKAARGGTSGHRFPWSETDTIDHSRANYFSTSGISYDNSSTRGFHPAYAVGGEPYTSPVGSFAANGYGLYDMAGNVWEWCWDWLGSYASGAETDPRGPNSGLYRVFRGGGWQDPALSCRTAQHGGNLYPMNAINFFGFRSVLRVAQ